MLKDMSKSTDQASKDFAAHFGVIEESSENVFGPESAFFNFGDKLRQDLTTIKKEITQFWSYFDPEQSNAVKIAVGIFGVISKQVENLQKFFAGFILLLDGEFKLALENIGSAIWGIITVWNDFMISFLPSIETLYGWLKKLENVFLNILRSTTQFQQIESTIGLSRSALEALGFYDYIPDEIQELLPDFLQESNNREQPTVSPNSGTTIEQINIINNGQASPEATSTRTINQILNQERFNITRGQIAVLPGV